MRIVKSDFFFLALILALGILSIYSVGGFWL